MKIRFWGVRGSVAVAGPKTQHFGGNTSCVEVFEKNHRVILDAGTGLRALGIPLSKKDKVESDIHLFITHCHLDHIVGLPFFKPLHHPKQDICLYGPVNKNRKLQDIVASVFSQETFPVSFDEIPAKLTFKELVRDKVSVGSLHVSSFQINHPGSTLGYVISNGKKKIAYLPDHEPIDGHSHFEEKSQAFDDKYNADLKTFLKGCDALIHDAFFTDAHYEKFHGWGHSPLGYPIKLVKDCGIKRLIYFHYAPEATDQELKRHRDWAAKKIKKLKMNVDLIMAREGLVINL